MAETWPDWSISVVHAGIDPIRVHEGILKNQVECLFSADPKVAFVLVRSINPVISTWDAMHVIGGWCRGRITPYCGQLHKELQNFAEAKGCRQLVYNIESYFLRKLIECAGVEGYIWLNQQ